MKAIFRQIEGETKYGAERMWVLIERIENDVIYGTLDNDPLDMPLIEAGMPVAIPLSHVISTAFSKDNPRPQTPERREYWDRCMVDLCVSEGRSHVDYLYRETPDMTQEGDEFPDSGWRLRGLPEITDAEADLENAIQYIALGAVLNKDDRWIHLIDEAPGVAFQWDPEAQDYIRFERPDLLETNDD
ncbi:immunity protein Imm33 domain-containing protein [Erythrobacter sp. HA6-11]